MKRILITGSDSYIGNSLLTYLYDSYPNEYAVDVLDVRTDSWRDFDFSGYDSVFHVAGIAHSDSGRKMNSERRELYMRVNAELPIEVAERAKAAGVSQIVFMSSIVVYGNSAPIGKKRVITESTEPSPKNIYSSSKMCAEKGLTKLADGDFRVCIIRSPMVYGRNSRGNYQTMSKMAKKLWLFPRIENSRSMIYVDNLMEFVRLMVENCEGGVFMPQNGEYTNTTEMMKMIAACHGRRLRTLRGFGWVMRPLSHVFPIINKIFGNMCYGHGVGDYRQEYRKYTLAESIKITESDNAQ